MSKTYQELTGQYEALSQTREYLSDNYVMIQSIFGQQGRQLLFMGCGSSYSISKAWADMAMMYLGRPAVALAAGDVMLRAEEYRNLAQGALVVVLSRSGETSELLLAIDSLKKQGAAFSVFSVCCSMQSSLSLASDATLELPWAFDSSVCQTRTISNLYFSGVYILARLSGRQIVLEGLERVIARGKALLLKYELQLKELSRRNWSHGIVLGDAEIGGICEVGALAFQEICQLRSNAFKLLDSRHGPIVIMRDDCLVIATINQVENAYQQGLLQEVVDRGASVMVVSDQAAHLEGTVDFAFGEPLPLAALGVFMITLIQMLTYHRAVGAGIDPDQPEGLRPWVKLQ